MKKLTLNLNALEVQSFATAPDAQGRGTVHAEECTCPTNICATCTCPGCQTCNETCPNTCWNTCDDPSCVTCGFSCGYESCDHTCHTMFCACNQSDFGTCIC
ncbi:MAG TPA: hypothetical protein VFR37_07300 [Longimicrobium sp.]|nr:hypothetical protein [Longimicrobium sp.]